MLRYLDANAKLPEQVAILTREGCSFCAQAKKMLSEAGIDYAEIPLPHTIRSKALGAIAKAQTVPQVFVDGRLIGGSEALQKFLSERARTPASPG
ncbi:MAG: glutathione S-transferase N-terminal domain-containing protein [Rhizobacter sp.]|nr:glutathione S-transferase N-terminal domain-containing protein [Rhizobacter sp.]